MKFDQYGQLMITEDELVVELYRNPNLKIENFNPVDPSKYNRAVTALHADLAKLQQYVAIDYKEQVPIELFDWSQQNNWYMPDEYKKLDIAQHVLDLCKTDAELQRVGQELLMFQEREMFDLLRYLKYFVDTMRANNVLWGLGRGSSVASYTLFLLGVHRINSLYYDLPIEEFLK